MKEKEDLCSRCALCSCEVARSSNSGFSLYVSSPDDGPTRMGLQESSEQIPGQCIPRGRGGWMFSPICWLVGWLVSKINYRMGTEDTVEKHFDLDE